MLVAMHKVDGALFDELERQFDKLDLTGDGQLTKQDLKIMAKRRMSKVRPGVAAPRPNAVMLMASLLTSP